MAFLGWNQLWSYLWFPRRIYGFKERSTRNVRATFGCQQTLVDNYQRLKLRKHVQIFRISLPDKVTERTKTLAKGQKRGIKVKLSNISKPHLSILTPMRTTFAVKTQFHFFVFKRQKTQIRLVLDSLESKLGLWLLIINKNLADKRKSASCNCNNFAIISS